MPIEYVESEEVPTNLKDFEFYLLAREEGQLSHIFERDGEPVACSIEAIAGEIPVRTISKLVCFETKRERFVRQATQLARDSHVTITTLRDLGGQQTLGAMGDYYGAEKRVQRFTRGLGLLMRKYGLKEEYFVMGRGYECIHEIQEEPTQKGISENGEQDSGETEEPSDETY